MEQILPESKKFKNSLSRKSEKKFISSILENSIPNPITKFKIDGQLYLVFPGDEKVEKFLNNKYLYMNSLKYRVVGEMKIYEKQSIVVELDNSCDCNHSGEEKKDLLDILTKRELQIIMLVAEGRVNKQIADQLNISIWTVSTHLRRIFAKLAVDSRAAMIYRCAKIIKQYKSD